jgi:DNA-binding MarR family transcriptional regulator
MTVVPKAPGTGADGSSDEAVKAAIIADLRAGFGEMRCVGSERLVRQGVSMTHLHMLSMLDHHGEMPMSRLAELLDISVSNATGLVDRLEERGFVERVRDRGDRRVVIARLSDRGVEMLREVQLLKESQIRAILAHLDKEQLAGVAKAIEDLRGAILSLVASEPDLAQHWHSHIHAN